MILLIFLAIYPASQITTDFNLEGFYREDDPVIEDYQLLEDEFGRDDNTILIGFRADDIIKPEILRDIRDLTHRFEEIPYIESVRSITNAEQIRNVQDQLDFSPYIPEIPESDDELSSLKSSLTEDPFLSGLLINQNATATSFLLTIREADNTYPNRNVIINQINEITGEYSGDYTFRKSGIPFFRNQYVNLLNGEIFIYIGLSSVLIILLLWYLYRSIWGVLFPMIIVWTTLLFTVAIIHLTGGYLEIMSSTIAPILLCVGVADAVHMISKYDDARESGIKKRASIIEMLKTLGSATFLTSVTTAIGFASLLSSSVVPMARFGAYTAAGVLLAYVITIFFLPVALSKSRKSRVFNEKSGSFYPAIQTILSRISAINRVHYKKILLFGLVGTTIVALGIKNVDVNGKVFDDLGDDTQLMQDSRFFSEQLAPQFPMEFIINTGEPDGAGTIDLLQRVDQFEEFLLGFDEIHRVIGLNQLIKEVHYIFRENNEVTDARTLPDSDATIAQYLLLLEINDAPELNRLTDFDYSKLRVTAFTEDAGSKRINEIRDEIDGYIYDHFTEDVTVTGTTILSADLTDKIVYSLVWSILIALVAISLIMTLLFRNVKMVLISLVPNVIPLLVIASVMGFLNVDIKPSTAVIFTIALGIAVDDSIHYLARFRIEMQRRGVMNAALSATTIKTGRAIVVTSFILIAGFGTLITSAFASTAMMGILVCSTIFAALIADLFILPSLFYWLRPDIKIGKKPELL
ncbi:RND family transporter [Rhodohalobacter sp. SW132]|uniref:efflux RND transporter permease subunit n=1 Tax=Rhodohalobacter sp. SW132 TaxID=2293433 RepID=UPI0011C024FA|nr:MMPL family transporter [Rhodohalobacter sp. SW132]